MSCSVNLTVVANSLRDPLAYFLEVSSKSHRLAKFALPLKTSIICGSFGWFRKKNEALLSYKVVERNQLVVGFPIDEGVLAFQNLYDEAIVSPTTSGASNWYKGNEGSGECVK